MTAARHGTARGTALTGIASGLAAAALCFQVTLGVITIVASLLLDGPSYVIAGRSMEPTIGQGTVVIDQDPGNLPILPGTIVTFQVGDQTVTHRVVEVAADGLVTRGDNNPTNDSTHVRQQDLLGVTTLVVPFVGLPRVWLLEADYVALGAWVVVTMVGIWIVLRPSPGGEGG